jgi:TolA-binding protein
LVLAIALALGITAAHAQTAADTEARTLYQRGASLYDEGRYEDAVLAWQQAYDLSPRPLLLYNIANALERLGRLGEALDALDRYRPSAGDDERTKVEARIDNLKRRVEEQRRREDENRRQTETREREELRRREAEAQALADREAEARQALARAEAAEAEAKKRNSKPHPAPIIVLASGGGVAAVGAVFEGLALGARQEAGNLCSADPVFCPTAAAPVLAKERSYAQAGDALVIAGGATAGVGLAFVIVDAVLRAGGKAPAVGFLPVGPRGGGGVILAGRFP